MSLRVGFDVTCRLAGATGVARYATELDRALSEVGAGEVELVRFAIGRSENRPPAGTRHVKVPLRLVHRSWRLLGRPSVERLVPGIDLVHALDLVPPPSACPVVMTVHDLAAVDHPEWHHPRAVRQQRDQLEATRRAAVVLADSQATADVLRRHGADGARTVVCPLGTTALPVPAPPPVPAGRFVLSVGSVDARKGTATLVRAFARANLPEHRLVLVGPALYQSRAVAELTASLGDRVVVTGHLHDAALHGLYREADLFCFPSLAEGFGLPVLEALAAGLPVIASDLAVVREVAGDAAVYVPPGDADALARALERWAGDAAGRASLGASGPDRAAQFTWARTAEITLDAYRAAVGAVRR